MMIQHFDKVDRAQKKLKTMRRKNTQDSSRCLRPTKVSHLKLHTRLGALDNHIRFRKYLMKHNKTAVDINSGGDDNDEQVHSGPCKRVTICVNN